MVNIFIANLDWEITSEDLKTTFSAFGPVNYAHVVYEKETKRSKGFGYVEMEETDHAINYFKDFFIRQPNPRALVILYVIVFFNHLLSPCILLSYSF